MVVWLSREDLQAETESEIIVA